MKLAEMEEMRTAMAAASAALMTADEAWAIHESVCAAAVAAVSEARKAEQALREATGGKDLRRARGRFNQAQERMQEATKTATATRSAAIAAGEAAWDATSAAMKSAKAAREAAEAAGDVQSVVAAAAVIGTLMGHRR